MICVLDDGVFVYTERFYAPDKKWHSFMIYHGVSLEPELWSE